MDEISFGPKHDFRLPSGRWLAATAAVALIAATVTLAISTSGRRVHRPDGHPVVAAAPTRSPAAAPGTLLLTCGSANWGGLGKGWRAGSLRAGPVWLVGGRQFAHLASHGAEGTRPGTNGSQRLSGAVMIVEVSDGSTVVMKATNKTWQYFHFVDGFNGPSGNPLPKGDTGFTFRSCPKGSSGPNGSVTDFYVGFSIAGRRAAPVEIRSSASSRPIRLIFASPGQRRGRALSSNTAYGRHHALELSCGTVHGMHLMPRCPTPLQKCSRYRMACSRQSGSLAPTT